MPTVTAADLILGARQRANLEGALSFIPDSEALSYANKSIAKWYDLVRLTTWGGQYFRASTTINLVQGQSYYGPTDGFPADFAHLISLDVFVTAGAPNSSNVMCGIPYQEEQRNMFRWWPTVAGFMGPLYFQLQGRAGVMGINFIPVPSPVSQVTINYAPVAPVLLTTDDELVTINSWEEWIILDVAIKMLVKDAQWDAVNALRADKSEETARIKQAAPAANMTGPELVHDVESTNRSRFPWGR